MEPLMAAPTGTAIEPAAKQANGVGWLLTMATELGLVAEMMGSARPGVWAVRVVERGIAELVDVVAKGYVPFSKHISRVVLVARNEDVIGGRGRSRVCLKGVQQYE